MKRYIVCLSLNYSFCEEVTAEVAKRNNAIGYEIITVGTKLQHQVAYRGEIIL